MRLITTKYLVVLVSVFAVPIANAGTILLDFTSLSTDIFGQQTGAFNDVPYSFASLNNAQVQQSVLGAVTDHFLDFPTMSQDANSFLPDGMELNWNFEIGTVGNAPINGDSEYYFIKVGTGLVGDNATNFGILGAAGGSVVRNSAGTVNPFSLTNGSVVGSVWTDHISSLAGLAADDAQLINLIAGTTSHEIGHTFSLAHAGAMSANPGQSDWGVMGSGATSMPNSQRVLDREFTYDKFNQLITAVGLRDTAAVPEPSSFAILFLGGLGFGYRYRRQARLNTQTVSSNRVSV